MANSEKRWKEIEDSIRQILLREWDPIGVGNDPEAQDEYDNYIQPIYWMLIKTRSEDEIAAFLHKVKTKDIGLFDFFSGKRNRGLARNLLALDVSGDE